MKQSETQQANSHQQKCIVYQLGKNDALWTAQTVEVQKLCGGLPLKTVDARIRCGKQQYNPEQSDPCCQILNLVKDQVNDKYRCNNIQQYAIETSFLSPLQLNVF